MSPVSCLGDQNGPKTSTADASRENPTHMTKFGAFELEMKQQTSI